MNDLNTTLFVAQVVILIIQLYLYKKECKALDKKTEELIETYMINTHKAEYRGK